MQNPGPPASLSNSVPFLIAPLSTTPNAISLDAAEPIAAGQDLVVTDPTTAASSAPLSVDFIGPLTNGNCEAQGRR